MTTSLLGEVPLTANKHLYRQTAGKATEPAGNDAVVPETVQMNATPSIPACTVFATHLPIFAFGRAPAGMLLIALCLTRGWWYVSRHLY